MQLEAIYVYCRFDDVDAGEGEKHSRFVTA